MKYLILFFLLILSPFLPAQESKKPLDHDAYAFWNTIEEAEKSFESLIKYRIQPGKGDPVLKVIDSRGHEISSIERGSNGVFSQEGHLVFLIKPQIDTVLDMKRRKVKEKDLPKDSLGILDLTEATLTRIPDVLNFSLPKKWSGWMVYELEDPSVKKEKNDKDKKDSFHMIIRELSGGYQDTVLFVTGYSFSKFAKKLIYHTRGDSLNPGGVFIYDTELRQARKIYEREGTYKGLGIDPTGKQVAFLIDPDTAKHQLPTYELVYWNDREDAARVLLKPGDEFLGENILNKHDSVFFDTPNYEYLFFSISLKPALRDTSLLEEEIPTVEVWSFTDGRLHTQQSIELEKDRKKGYLNCYSIKDKKFVSLSTPDIPECQFSDTGIKKYILGISDLPYQKYISWEGFPARYDLYRIDLDGNRDQLAENVVSSSINISPFGRYAFWSNEADTSWYIYSFEKKMVQQYGTSYAMFSDELNDKPNHPQTYGFAGWTNQDKYFLVYDRYDLWKINAETGDVVRITRGREDQTIYRFEKSDPEDKYIQEDRELILLTRNEKNEDRGIALLKLQNSNGPRQLLEGPEKYKFLRIIDDKLLITRESFQEFPDLQIADREKGKLKKLTNVNPWQNDYLWGISELYEWTAFDGQKLKGILVKPENFDPARKYPLLVNFYERSSDDLHNHRHPFPHRSTINYTFYASRGYVIFNPDVTYKTGHPGESCYNSVISGMETLIDQGFIDKDRIGVQGHSWGGYQVAYLVTRTDLFAAAEAGAPVPNMTSAYGGIRWWTGLSRMFQYEHTQSRIGGTLWDSRDLFIENSPIFFLDKVNTPLLIMHNDKDGHVPWYQGIELFVALRRLQKPAWMLNYSGEPHWPLKWQNRVDFNIRMQQYFDHFLIGAPMPRWMSEGIPAMEEGIDLKYELEGNK